MPDRAGEPGRGDRDRLPGEPEPRFSEGQETDEKLTEQKRIGDFASRPASMDEIGPQGEAGRHHTGGHGDEPAGAVGAQEPGSVAGDALERHDDPTEADHPRRADRPGRLRGDLTAGLTDAMIGPDSDEGDRHPGDDQADRPEQERHRRFSEGQEYAGDTSEKDQTGDFASGQREEDDDR